ncbi:MAG: KAP family NTPase [Flavobacteriales bacterium]|nr:KAP family NTPase [Flavobacteriales bacterium]
MCAKRKEIEFLTDQPIKSVEDDKFGRADFVKAIAEVIHSQTTQVNTDKNPEFKDIEENMIIGLYGSWGFGKSSIMHMLDDSLPESVQTAFFNPWMYNSEEHLIISLFNTIVELSGLTKDSKTELISLIKKYQPLISLASNSAGKISKAITEIGNESVTMNAVYCKEQIDKKLLENANPVVIFIDDVDRLSKDEIHVLFKTLRLIANFKKIIYVVAFDFEMVSKSIKENYADGKIEDGKAFIEKIVQIPIRIPEIESKKLLKYSTELINQTFHVDLSGNAVFKSLVSYCIHTPRDVKRFVNGFRFTHHYLNDTILTEDLIVIELIRSKDHFLFKLITIYYRAIKNQWNSAIYRREIMNAFNENLPHLIKTDERGSRSIDIYSFQIREYNSVFVNLFSLSDLETFAYESRPNGHGQLDYKAYTGFLLQHKSGSEIMRSLKNPQRLIDYFEKSSILEMNQELTPSPSSPSES